MDNNEVFSKEIVNIKGIGRLSAESIVTARVSIEIDLKDGAPLSFFQVNVTAPAIDLDVFLSHFTSFENTQIEIEILDVIQPQVRVHDENLKWLDNLQRLARGNDDADES